MKKKIYTYNQNFNSFFQGDLNLIEINREKRNKRLTTKDFIKKAEIVHGDSFDYSKSVYVNMSTKITIICKKHNIEFTQTPINHLHASIGCSMCNKNIKSKIKREKFIKKVNKKSMMICSTGEKLIEHWLNKNFIEYEKQKTFAECKNQRKLRYDFYLPKQDILIEYDGRQHFKPIECFGGKNEFVSTQINDKIKTEYAINNGYMLLRIPYTERKNLSEVLKNNITIK
jgi:very-short-patch-repair endonuclease